MTQTTCRRQECVREAAVASVGEGRSGQRCDRSLKARLEQEVEKYDELPAIGHGCKHLSPLSYWRDAGSPSHDDHGHVAASSSISYLVRPGLSALYLMPTVPAASQTERVNAAGFQVQRPLAENGPRALRKNDVFQAEPLFPKQRKWTSGRD